MSVSEIRRYPPNTSDTYISARDSLAEAEYALSKQIEAVAAQRRQLPTGAIMKDYVFNGPEGTTTSLADLAADGRNVVIYHLMFGPDDKEPCSMCGMFLDGQNGVGKHLDQNVNLAVVARGPIETVGAYAKKRGWDKLRFLSSENNSFDKDMNVQNPNYEPDSPSAPGFSVFKKDGEGDVRHVYSQTASFVPGVQRGLDLLCPVYNVLDLIPEGRGQWWASNEYVFK